nr:reverse transcriptase domain-containing protein [Tanacetum cinerariifolium]
MRCGRESGPLLEERRLQTQPKSSYLLGKKRVLVRVAGQKTRMGLKIEVIKGGGRNIKTCAFYARREGFTPLTKTPKEILAMDNVNFPPPPTMARRQEEQGLDQRKREDYQHVDALIEGFRVRRIHVDGDSSSDDMYKHCFRNLRYQTRSRRQLDKVKKPPKSSVEEKIMVNDNYPEQLITIRGGLSTECRNALIHTFRKNVDIFTWTTAYMTGIPRAITEHSLDTYPYIKPKVQKKGSLTLDRRKVVTDEVNELLKADAVFKWETGSPQSFLSNSAKRSLSFFDTLKKCTNKKDFRWIEAAEAAFLEMKKLVFELPTLTTPKKGDTLMMYLAVMNDAVSAVLLTERDVRQIPIHY